MSARLGEVVHERLSLPHAAAEIHDAAVADGRDGDELAVLNHHCVLSRKEEARREDGVPCAARTGSEVAVGDALLFGWDRTRRVVYWREGGRKGGGRDEDGVHGSMVLLKELKCGVTDCTAGTERMRRSEEGHPKGARKGGEGQVHALARAKRGAAGRTSVLRPSCVPLSTMRAAMRLLTPGKIPALVMQFTPAWFRFP